MKKLILFLTVYALLSSAATAQQITGVVKDGQRKGIEMVTVSLLRCKDSSVIKLAVTAASGKYYFTAPGAGTYLITATHGYSNFAGQYSRFSGTIESRQCRTALTWRFGSNTVKAANQRKDASEEEKNQEQRRIWK